VEGNKQRCVKKTSRVNGCKRKAETVQSNTVGYYPRSKLCCLGMCSIQYDM